MSSYDDRRRQEEADAAYARRLQAEEHDQTRDQTTASARTISQMNSDLLAKIEEQEQCDLPGHISKTKNKHAGAGLSRGLQSAVGGVAAVSVGGRVRPCGDEGLRLPQRPHEREERLEVRVGIELHLLLRGDDLPRAHHHPLVL